MSWVCLSGNKVCVARKAHRCDVCNEKINKGDQQVTRSGVEEGEGYYRMHMHPECEEYSSDWKQWDWECNSPGSISRAEVLGCLADP